MKNLFSIKVLKKEREKSSKPEMISPSIEMILYQYYSHRNFLSSYTAMLKTSANLSKKFSFCEKILNFWRKRQIFSGFLSV